MIVQLILASLLAVVSALATFLFKEHKKKFGMNAERLEYAEKSGQLIKTFCFFAAQLWGSKPGMKKVSVKSSNEEPFFLAVHLKFGEELIDLYLTLNSGPKGLAVFETYFGNSNFTLVFEPIFVNGLPSKEVDLIISKDERNQKPTLIVSAPPHWFQKEPIAGFFYWIGRKILKLV